ncbi:MAG TPA: lysylphosphatidylglycerol synthase domain-containing protein [Xanthobacteraceae bacterium]|jgi:putative membrane protein
MPIKIRRNLEHGHVSASLILAAVGGFLLLVYLIAKSGAADVAHAMLVIGWWLIPITLYHLVPLTFSALSWRELLPPATRPNAVNIIWIRWIRNSINSLLPVAGVGGDIASVRLVRLRGVPGIQAAASMVVDVTLGVTTQLMFVLSGVALLLMRSTEHRVLLVAWGVLIGTGTLLAAVAAFVLLQHRGLFHGSAKLTRRLLPRQWLSLWMAGASEIDDAVVAAYRSGHPILGATVLQLFGWASSVGEIWLVMQALGQPLSVVDAYILESLVSGVRAATFMIPGALGALEGSFVLFGAVFGLPSETALAISLSKRVRELALGLPGLFVWHWMEGHHLLRRSAPTHGSQDPADRNCAVAKASTRDGSHARSSK